MLGGTSTIEHKEMDGDSFEDQQPIPKLNGHIYHVVSVEMWNWMHA